MGLCKRRQLVKPSEREAGDALTLRAGICPSVSETGRVNDPHVPYPHLHLKWMETYITHRAFPLFLSRRCSSSLPFPPLPMNRRRAGQWSHTPNRMGISSYSCHNNICFWVLALKKVVTMQNDLSCIMDIYVYMWRNQYSRALIYFFFPFWRLPFTKLSCHIYQLLSGLIIADFSRGFKEHSVRTKAFEFKSV